MSTVQLTWIDNAGGAQTFNVERSVADAYTGFVEIADGIVGALYDDVGLADSTYWYRVRGFDGVNYSDYSNVIQITTTT